MPFFTCLKVSKLQISPVPSQAESRTVQTEPSETSQRIASDFLSTPASVETTVRSFYPTPRPSPKPSQVVHQITQHIHVSPGVSLLKPHHITINLPPPDIQRIVQSPPPLLPSQSRVIVTAKASVSDESGRPLNTTQLVTLPLPTIPVSYDDYKEGDESFDPFYRDVPKIRKNRQVRGIEKTSSRSRRSLDQSHRFVYGVDDRPEVISESQSRRGKNEVAARREIDIENFQAIKDSLIKFRDILFSDEVSLDKASPHPEVSGEIGEHVPKDSEASISEPADRARDNAIRKSISLEDLKMEPSRHLALDREEDSDEEEEEETKKKAEGADHAESSSNFEISFDDEKHSDDTLDSRSKSRNNIAKSTERNKSQTDVIDVIILDSNFQEKSARSNVEISKNDAPIEIILEDKTSDNIGQVAQSDWREQSIIAELDEKKQSEIPHETAKRKDFRGQKSSSRKSARMRSSRRRISSKIKQQKTRYVEVTELPREKKTDGMTTTISSITTTTPSTTTATPSTISTTIMPAATVAPFETRIMEQINSHIFGESESQTSKEIDTRAVGQRDATYSKSLRDDKGRDVGKTKETVRSFDHQITKYHGKNPEGQRADKFEEEREEERTEPMSYLEATTSSQDTNLTEEPQDVEQAESMEVTKAFEEDGHPEELSVKEQEALDDESNANAHNEEPEEASEETPNKITHKITDSREDSLDLEEESSQRGNQAEELHIEDEERKEEHSLNSKATSYEDLDEYQDEYQDTTDSSAENTRNSSTIQEDYAESINKEKTPTTTVDYANFEEYSDSQEDIAEGTRGTESNTEGVLKFTDELPQLENEDDEEAEETLEVDKDDTDDYVDDNYEPENYKEIETTVKPRGSKEESAKEYDEAEEEDQDDSLEVEMHTERGEDITDVVEEVADSTTPSSSTTMPSTISSTTTAPTTTTISTTMSTTSTTDSTTPSTTTMMTSRRPMTTISRGTPPKLFKPVGVRKIYAFIPPTTTPIPVVIKPRMGLYNPKPAKPPKSYNELAPKPVIRKITLPTRKPATTTTTTTTIIGTITANATEDTTATSAAITATAVSAENLSTENPETTTEPMTTMTTTLMPSTTVTTTTTESGRSEENVLESKLEPIEPIVSLHLSSSVNQENKDDQLSSSTFEQNSRSPLSNDTDARISTRKAEDFTPYPLSRLSTLALPIEQTTQKMETVEPYETTEKIDDVATTIPSMTQPPEERSASYIESTSSTAPSNTEEYSEEAITTLAATRVHRQETTEASVSFEQSTSFPNIQPNVITSTDPPAIFRPNIRKFMIPRKPVESFNCLEKEMYRFYGDTRDCRLFHYCSPGFTSRQVLDFRFVCEEGTAFDEETRSCRHDVRNRKCRNRSW